MLVSKITSGSVRIVREVVAPVLSAEARLDDGIEVAPMVMSVVASNVTPDAAVKTSTSVVSVLTAVAILSESSCEVPMRSGPPLVVKVLPEVAAMWTVVVAAVLLAVTMSEDETGVLPTVTSLNASNDTPEAQLITTEAVFVPMAVVTETAEIVVAPTTRSEEGEKEMPDCASMRTCCSVAEEAESVVWRTPVESHDGVAV